MFRYGRSLIYSKAEVSGLITQKLNDPTQLGAADAYGGVYRMRGVFEPQGGERSARAASGFEQASL